MGGLKYKVLLNGFQIIYEKPESSIPLSSIQIFCNIGSVYLPKELYGITHFIEHMCFKKTKNNPNFNNLLQYADMGAEYNGYSYKRCTVFAVKCEDEYVNKCIKLLSEQLLNAKFDKAEFKKEENVVIEEKLMTVNDPKNILSNLHNKLLYENTLYQNPVDDISFHKKKYDYNLVLDFYKKNYIPSNMILSITSNIPFSKILDFIKKTDFYKKSIDLHSVSLHDKYLQYLLFPPIIKGIKCKIFKIKDFKSILLNLSFQICNQFDLKEKYIFSLLSYILCNSLTSRLAKILRQDYGLVYYISAITDYNEGGGEFTITTQCNSTTFLNKVKPSVLPLIIKELNKLIKFGITSSELSTAKHNVKGQILLELENISNQTNYNGFTLLYQKPNEIVPYSKLYEIYYDKITKHQIDYCIKKYFNLMRMCITVVGNMVPNESLILEECMKLKNTL